MAAPDEQNYLPKEPLDLPKPELALPEEPKELPAPHENHQSESQQIRHAQPTQHRAVKTLLSWHAPGRPYRKKKKEFYFNVFLIVIAIEIILFLFSQTLLMTLVLGLMFLSFSLSLIPPHDFFYKISTEGVMIEDHFFLWKELYDFYLKRINGVDVVILDTQVYFPGEVSLVLGDIHPEQIKTILLDYLPYREYVKPTITERMSDWLVMTFPLERLE